MAEARKSKFLLITLPTVDWASYSSVEGRTPPFLGLKDVLERDLGRALAFADIAIGPGAFAEMREELRRWARQSRRVGLLPEGVSVPTAVEAMSIQGITAPRVNPRLPSRRVLVAEPGNPRPTDLPTYSREELARLPFAAIGPIVADGRVR